MKTRNVWSTLALVLVAAVAYFLVYGYTAFQPRVFALDYVAFYCAGQVTDEGADPYRTEPLRSCEHTVGAAFRKNSVLALPAPLPAYDIGIFRILALLPFRIAVVVWTLLLTACCIAIICLTAELTGLEFVLPVSALAIFLLCQSIYLGQIAPFTMLGVLLMCRGLRNGKQLWLGLGTALACIEPHLGLPSIVCVFVFGTLRMRLVVAAAAIGVAVVALVSQPIGMMIEYVRLVLPAHAASEIEFHEQYGLAYNLHALGIATEAALRLSEFAFAAILILGLFLARRWWNERNYDVALFGIGSLTLFASPFLHITQIAFAIPAALMLYALRPGRLSAVATLLLAFPWNGFAVLVSIAPLFVAAFTYLARRLLNVRPTVAMIAATVAILVLALGGFAVVDTDSKRLIVTSATPLSLAEVSWREAVSASIGSLNIVYWIAKLPTFAGLAIVCLLFAMPGRSSVRLHEEPLAA